MVATETPTFNMPEEIVEVYTRLDETYRPVINSFVRRYVGNPELAEDLTQEVLLRALKALPTALKRGDLQEKSWLFKIASRLIIDNSRRRKFRERAAPMTLLSEDIEAVDDENPQQTVEGHETQAQVRKALSNLKPEYRQTLEMYYLNDMSCHEMKDRLGIKWSGVKSRIARGRQSFKEEYLKLYPESVDASVI